MGIKPYLKIDKHRLKPLLGDPAAMFWYQVLVDYSKRFKPDKLGFIRINKKTIMDDYGLNRDQIQYLNRKLCKVGVIRMDTERRGNRTPAGYRIL